MDQLDTVEVGANGLAVAARRSRAVWWVVTIVATVVAVGLVAGFARHGFDATGQWFAHAGWQWGTTQLLHALRRAVGLG